MKTSIVVLRKTMASNWSMVFGSKFARSSLTTVSKAPVFLPSSVSASFPVGIEEWRKPAVLEKTRTFRGFDGLA